LLISLHSQLLSNINTYNDHRPSEPLMLLMPIFTDTNDRNAEVIIYNMTCRTIISLGCSVVSIIKHPRIELIGNPYVVPCSGYNGVRPTSIGCTNFTVLECKPHNIRHLITEYKFINWCGRYGE
jgi:hypothetical protein